MPEETIELMSDNSLLSNKETTATDVNVEPTEKHMSKRQVKRLRKLEKYLAQKKEKRLKERERQKQKILEARAQGLPTRIGPSRKALQKMKPSEGSFKLAVDLEFDDLMSDKDICKCVQQLLRIYTINRRSSSPCTLYFVGLKENGKIHECLKRNDGYENWHVQWLYEPYVKLFPNNEIIYLTSDSTNVLEEINVSTVYIIGGLVDHNHRKGLCYERATNLNIKTARLPLGEHVHMKTRTVLSTYHGKTEQHVFEIMLRVREGNSWSEAIMNTLPKRKGAIPIEDDNKGKPANLTISENLSKL